MLFNFFLELSNKVQCLENANLLLNQRIVNLQSKNEGLKVEIRKVVQKLPGLVEIEDDLSLLKS